MDQRLHWDEVYERVLPTRVSWYQRAPEVSLELIDLVGLPPGGAVIDVGGGTSTLVAQLVTRGFTDVSVLDISSVALANSRKRLGPAGERVCWVCADVLAWTPERTYDLWHDRAVFHFLVDPADRQRYVRVARLAVRQGGYVIVATFAMDGPARCSGLPVERYDSEGLCAAFSPGFALVGSRRELHTTPSGAVQPFTWVVLRFSEE